MPLHLDLYHEVHKAKKMQRRDPLKLATYAMGAIACGFAGYYFIELGRMHSIRTEFNRSQAEFDKVSPQAKAASKREEELTAQIKISDLLVKRIEGRFYWAPLLSQLAQIVPGEVQITKFDGDVIGDSPTKTTLVLEGLTAGESPRRIAEELRTALSEKLGAQYRAVTSTFRSLEDGTETVTVAGQPWPTATFAIVVEFQSGEEAASIAPTRKKS